MRHHEGTKKGAFLNKRWYSQFAKTNSQSQMKSTKTKTTTFRKKGKHITDAERQIIEKLYRKGVPVPQITDLLEVHRSTIYRELQRGRVNHLNSELIPFSTYSADRASDERKLRATAHGPSLKIANDRALVSQFNKLLINLKNLSEKGSLTITYWPKVLNNALNTSMTGQNSTLLCSPLLCF